MDRLVAAFIASVLFVVVSGLCGIAALVMAWPDSEPEFTKEEQAFAIQAFRIKYGDVALTRVGEVEAYVFSYETATETGTIGLVGNTFVVLSKTEKNRDID